MKFLALEVLCVLVIAVGFTVWLELGVGLVVAGVLGLPLVVASEYNVARRSRRGG